MGSHPINLLIRFLLELAALISVGLWAWKNSEGWLRYILAFIIPLLLAIIWGVFTVPDDPSRSGAASIVTPGLIRLIIELGFFTFAIWSLYDSGYQKTSYAMGLVVFLHYLASYDRIGWLLEH